MLMKDEVAISNNGWDVTILPSYGANAIKLLHHGIPVLRSPSCFEDLVKEPYLYGMPILFPANRTRGGKFTFAGKEYQLPINEPGRGNHLHGLIWNATFITLAVNKNSASFKLINRGEYFPFPFAIEVSYHLTKRAFVQRTRIRNIGPTAMPALLAFHTTFCAYDTYQVPIGYRWERDPDTLIPTNKLLSLTDEEIKIAQGTASCSQPIVGYFTSTGNLARVGDFYYEVSSLFTQWVLYNGDGNQGFICVEPQTNPVNGLNYPGSHLIIKQDEELIFETRIFTVKNTSFI